MKSHSHEYDLKLFQNSGEESAPSHVASSSLYTSRIKLNSPSPPLISSAMQASYEFFSRDFCSHMKRNRQEQKLKYLGAPR